MKTHSLLSSVALAVGVAANSAAQGAAPAQLPPGQPHVIAFPDTMGANFAIADSATAQGSPTDFDFLLGDWEFTFQNRRSDGQWNTPFKGRWSASKKAVTAGALLVDLWQPVGAPKIDDGTWTFRSFNAARKLWEIQGADAGRGHFEPGLTWSDAQNRYVVQRAGASLMRIRYFNITQNSFQWRADRSADGGQTWVLDWWSMDVKRVVK